MNFNEVFRIDDGNDDGAVWATPTVTYDGHTIFTSKDGIRFAGPNMNTVPTVKGTYTITAPTILRDGRIVVMATDGSITVLNGEQVVTRIPIEFSVASAAASHTHFFVSTWHHFITFDATTLQEVGRFDWPDGGLSSPAIGPQGNVYVIASNQLYVFPGPGQAAVATTGTVGNPALPVTQSPVQPVATQPAQPAEPAQPSQASRKAYKPPLTASGNRLFACQDPGGDDCGKGDAKDIAKAFCQKQGFTAAADLDLDTRKGKAETLDGQFCARNKCRVFSKIVCAN
jgi:hypothetical protein